MLMGVQISFQVSVFISFRYIPRGRIAGLYGSSIFKFLGPLVWQGSGGCGRQLRKPTEEQLGCMIHPQVGPYIPVFLADLSLGHFSCAWAVSGTAEM